MSQATAGGTGATKQLVNILALAFPRQLHKAQFRELGNLRSGLVSLQRPLELLQYVLLIAEGIHINEVHDNHARNVAQAKLTGNFDGGLTVGPQDRFASCG